MNIKEFGEMLFLLRANKGMSVREVGKATGVNATLIDYLERGARKSFPHHKTLSSLCDFYDVRFQYIPDQLLIVSVPTIEPLTEIMDINEIEEIKGMKTMKEIKIFAIQKTLEECNWNRAKAARVLKIGERTLYRKIKDYEIDG